MLDIRLRVLAHDCHVMVNKIRKRDPKEGHEQAITAIATFISIGRT